MDNLDLIFILFEILLAVGLWVLADFAHKYENSKWKLLYLLPAFICLLFLWAGGTEISLLPAYCSGAVFAIGFFREGKQIRRYSCIAGGFLTIAGLVVCLLNPGYRMPDFSEDFKETFASLKAHYCLGEHKAIDWDALYAKYLPKFQQADAHHDAVENIMVWSQFTDEFYDGHVNFGSFDDAALQEAKKRAFGKDYGLSLLRLTDGRIVAVNVEPDSPAREAGIYNGCEITGWDLIPPEELTGQVEYQLFASPDKENEDFYKMLYVAGIGGDSVTVTFKDTDGNSKQAVLSAIGDYADRLEDTLTILDQGMNISTLSWAELSDDTVLFRVKDMSYDTKSYAGTNYAAFRQEMEEKLLQYTQEGKDRLILDIRCNGGGSPYMILTMAELLADEGEHFFMYTAVLNEKTCEYEKDPATGKYLKDKPLTYQGRNLWGHGKILLLVNGQCISAGDWFTQIMSEMENVTIMGVTKSNASGQAILSIKNESGMLTFSAIPSLDQNGDPFIDPGPERVSPIPLDVKVPLDETAVRMLFDEGKDYVLWYAQQNW